MLRGGCGVVEKTQRDPAGGEFLLGLVDVAGRKRRVAGDQIGGAAFAEVEHLARHQAPFDPPFVQIIKARRVPWCAQHQLGGLGEFLLAAQQLDLAEDVAGVAAQFIRNRLEQGLGIAGFLVVGDACFRERDVACAQSLRRAHRDLVLAAIEHEVHPRLLVARRQQRAEQVERGAFGVLGHRIVSPGLAHQAFGIGPVAAREHRPRQRESALGG